MVTAPLPFSGMLPGWQSSFVSGSGQYQPFFLISPLRGVSAPPKVREGSVWVESNPAAALRFIFSARQASLSSCSVATVLSAQPG